MELNVGQKVAYPSQGVCLIEKIKKRMVGDRTMKGYYLRVLSDNSVIFVPTANAESVGIRPIIGRSQYRRLLDMLGGDFEPVSCDWKLRSREFTYKLHSGSVFEAADVLKKLTFLSGEKKLSFREQILLEKAKFLIVSEIVNLCDADEEKTADRVDDLVRNACRKHQHIQPKVLSASVH